MTTADLDAALLDMTDSQIMALLARRTAGREQRKREQTAARVRKHRATDCNATCNEGETQIVTQKDGYSSSECNANSNALVTQPVTQKPIGRPSPSPSLPRPLPSAPPPLPSPARTREDADILTLAKSTFTSPEILAEVPGWIEHCREHAEKRGKAFSLYTVRQQFQELARMGEPKALLAIRSSGAKGSASIIDPDEKRFAGINGHGKPNGQAKPATPDIRAGIDETNFLAWYYTEYPNARPGMMLIAASAGVIARYKEGNPRITP